MDNKSLTELSNVAFRAATVTAIKRAKATSTAIIFWENGQIKRISGDDLDGLLEEAVERQAAPPTTAPS